MTEPIPMLDLKAQYATLRADIQAAIERVMESQNFILGPEVEALEREIAAYSHCRFGVGVSSGTDALLLALMTIGIRPGDEVITTAYSFFATAGSIVRLGARPVFVDIHPDTLNIHAQAIEARITPRTRAILPVHLCGQMADMETILAIAQRYNLYVIEDACQAIGADFHGQRAGSLGHLGCFSFFPSKNLGGAGDSGMIVCNDPHLADRAVLLRNHGHRPKYYNQAIGGNFRMDALQAAILRAKFPHLETWTAARGRNAALYAELFRQAGLAGEDGPITLPREAGWGRHIYHLYQIRAVRRDELMAFLKSRGIASEIYYPVPLHRQECFAGMGFEAECPQAERASRETLALPIYPELTPAQIERVVTSIQEFYRL
ncbi:MAG: transcriptional regulator [Anaerolineae bacterium]|nr:MAG: transcriptional regulator [Anaerolineae bacterium]